MTKDYNIAYKTIFKAIFLTCFIGSVYLLSQVYSYFNSGADPKNILNLSKDVYSIHKPSVTWQEEDLVVGLKMDKYEKQKIEENYLLAWHMMNIGLKQRAFSQLEDFFSDSLIVKMKDHLNTSLLYEYEQLDLEHNIYPKFQAIDKQLLIFEDKCVKVKKRLTNIETGTVVYNDVEFNNYKIAMSLDDGRWQIQHMEKKPCGICKDSSIVSPIKNYAVDNKQFYANNLPLKLQGINYYPAKHPWSLFWKNFDVNTFREDILVMQKYKFNTIRIFIPYEEFGGGQPKIEYLDKLKLLLDELEVNGMTAMVTLFDYPKGFSWEYYTRTERHLQKILAHCKSHPAILAFDLKNEPDLDIELYGEEVLEWLSFIIERSRHYAPDKLFTIGWSNPESASLFSDQLDFVSFHYYRETNNFLSAVNALSFQCNGKLLVLSEFGYPSFESSLLPVSKTALDQQDYVAEMMDVVNENSIPYYFWTLHDFSNLPSEAFSILPWRKNQQKHFGIIDTAGINKPVAQVFEKREFEFNAQNNLVPRYVKNWLKLITALILLIGMIRFLKAKFRPI